MTRNTVAVGGIALFSWALLPFVLTARAGADAPDDALTKLRPKIAIDPLRQAPGIGEQVRRAQLRMKKEKLTPRMAWRKGVLTAPIVRHQLNQLRGVDSARGLWNPSVETYEYTGLLWQHAPHVWKSPLRTMTVPLKVRLAQHLMARGGSARSGVPTTHAEVLLQAALRELPKNETRFQEVGGALYTLIRYYRRMGQPRKAADTAMRILDFSKDPRNRANYVLEAARAYRALGDYARAERLYKQIMGYGYGWAIGHTLSDRASYLFSQGKTEAARAVLKQKIPGYLGDQFQVVLSQTLAYSYESTGELDQALFWARTATRQFDALRNPIKNHGLEFIAESARQQMRRLERTKNEPLSLATNYVGLMSVRSPQNKMEGELVGFLTIYSRQALPAGVELEVKSEDPRILIEPRLPSIPTAARRHTYILRMEKSALTESEKRNPASFDVTLQARSPLAADYVLHIPLQLLVRAAKPN